MLPCINFEKLPSARATAEQLSKEFDGLLSPYQVGQLWNVWLNQDVESRKSEAPTKDDILQIYGDLAVTSKKELFENQSIANKEKVIDALQFLFFHGIKKLSGTNNLTSEVINKYKNEVFAKIPVGLKKQGHNLIADNFESYKEYFVKQRLTKLGVQEIDSDFEEQAVKDNVSNISSLYIENKKNASDEVVWLIASLNSEEKIFGNLQTPVDFEQTWNILQNILGNSLNFDDQIVTLKQYSVKYPWMLQLLDRLGVTDKANYSPELNKIVTSFTEAFSKQKSDIVVASAGPKDSYSSIDSKTKNTIRERFKSNFFTSEYVERINGELQLNKKKYNELKLQNTDADLMKFLEVFGFENIESLTPEDRKNISFIKKQLEANLDKPIRWIDDKVLDVKSRVENIIETYIPLEQENKTLSAPNAEGKQQYAVHNHNYYSRLASKLRKGIVKAKNYFEELFSENLADTVVISGLQNSQSGDEKLVFNNLDYTDIFNTLFSNMFSNNPIIHLPRTADKAMERGFRINTKNQDDYMAFTKISPKLMKNLYDLFNQDSLDKLHPDWDYGVPNDDYLAFWESIGIEKGFTLQQFTEAINKYIADQQQETKNLLLDLGLIRNTPLGWEISFTDSALNKLGFKTASIEKKNEFINQMINNFNFNMFYFGVGYTKSQYGSLVPVKAENMFKRFAAAVAEGRQVSISENLASEIALDYKKQGFNYNPNSIKVLVHKGTIRESEDEAIIKYSKKYSKNDIDDAQGLVTLPIYRTLLKGANQWTDLQEKAYQEVMQGKTFDKSVFPPLKPVGYSLLNINGYKVPVYIKTSIYPMSPADVKGLNNELKYNYAKEKGIGLFVPKTAIKMATPKKLKDVLNNKGQINNNPTFDFPIEDFRIQLDIGVKESTKQLQGTQERKLLYTNLFNQGNPLDPKYKTWLENNIDTLEKLADIERKKLYDTVGIKEIVKNGKVDYEISNYGPLKQLIKDELITREYPINTVESINSIIDTNGNLLGTIDGLPSRQKIMNLLNSIVTNRLIRLYTNGSSLVQVSQQGWEMQAGSTVDTPSAIDFISKEAKESYIENGGLKFFDLGEKTGAAEVLLPAKFKPFVKKSKEGYYVIDDEKVLMSIGYRIPTQGHNSILHLRVIGFLPDHLNQMVVVPKEITTQGGSDFDVDKLNLFIPNSIILDGKIKYISSDMNPEEVFLKKKESYENLINYFNKKIEQYYKKVDKAEKRGEEYISDEVLQMLIENPELDESLDLLEIKNVFSLKDFTIQDYEKIYNKLTKLITKEGRVEWIENFKKKQLQNQLIEQAVQVLEDPQIRSQLVTPNSADSLQKSSENISKMLKDNGLETKKPELKWSNLFNGITLAKTIYQMFASKALVGVFASQSTHHTLGQQVGLHFNNVTRRFYFNHNKTKDGKPDLSGIYGVTGLVISDRLGNEYLTAAVDAAKDDYLTELGVTLQTGDLTALYERLGGDPEYLYAWIGTPVIQRYLELKRINNSITTRENNLKVSQSELIAQVIKEFRLPEIAYNNNNKEKKKQINEERDVRGDYSIEDIHKYWPNREAGTAQIAADLLDDFLYFEDAAQVLRQSVSTTKFDTAGPGKNLAEAYLLKFKYDNFVNKMIESEGYTLGTMENNEEGPYTDLIFKTQLKVFYKSSFNFVNSIYQDLTVLRKNANIYQVFKLLTDPSSNWVNKFADSQEADLIYGSIVNYMIQNEIGYREDLFFGDNTLGHRLVKIQKDPSNPLYDNPIIQEFFNIEIKPSLNEPTIISPVNKYLSADEASYYTGKFEEIKSIDKELYEDLITVALFQTGVIQSPVSYYNQLPYHDLIPLVNNSLKKATPDFNTINSTKNILKNISSKLKNIKFTSVKNAKLNNGILTLSEDIPKNIIKTSLVKNGPKLTFVKVAENTFLQVTNANYRSLFYNFTKNSENMEEEKDIEYDTPDDMSESEAAPTTQPSTSIKPTIANNANTKITSLSTQPGEEQLTFEEWYEQFGSPLKDKEWNKNYYNNCIKK